MIIHKLNVNKNNKLVIFLVCLFCKRIYVWGVLKKLTRFEEEILLKKYKHFCVYYCWCILNIQVLLLILFSWLHVMSFLIYNEHFEFIYIFLYIVNCIKLLTHVFTVKDTLISIIYTKMRHLVVPKTYLNHIFNL